MKPTRLAKDVTLHRWRGKNIVTPLRPVISVESKKYWDLCEPVKKESMWSSSTADQSLQKVTLLYCRLAMDLQFFPEWGYEKAQPTAGEALTLCNSSSSSDPAS